MSESTRFVLIVSKLSLFLLLVSGCSLSFTQSGNGSGSEPAQVNVPVVEAVQSRLGSLPLSERLTGTVISQNQVVLFPEISGRIVRVLARNGELVQKGDSLAILDDSQYREQMKQAEANLRVNLASLSQANAQFQELEVQFRRTAMLAEEGLSSDLEVETLRAQLDSARATIELAEAQIQESESQIEEMKTILLKTEVRAPITGTIGRRNAEVGMQASPNAELFTIGDLDQLRVEVVLTSEALRNVRVGQSVRIYASTFGAGRRVFEAKLSRISPFLDPVTRSTEAEIDIQDQGVGLLRPGMSVSAEILYGESLSATLLPSSALYTHPSTGEEGVYLLTSFEPSAEPVQKSGGVETPVPPVETEFRPVDIVAEGRMEVGVRGLDPDTWVVTVGQNLLAEGREQAQVRATTWERVMELQRLQREDLLEEVLQGE